MAKTNELTSKEKAFAEEYVSNGYKVVDAYLKAYPNAGLNTAKADAWKVLKRDRVKEYITELQQEAFDRQCITAERIAAELAEIAFAEKGDETYTTNFKLKAIELLQKQFGLQQQKIDANVNTTVITVTIEEDEEK